MKYFLSILLLLSIFLCGCTVSTDRNPYSNQPLPTGAVDHGDGVLSGEVHSDIPMQLIRDYQTKELFVESGLSKVVEDTQGICYAFIDFLILIISFNMRMLSRTR